MAARILPYVRDRPLVMARYPDGIGGQRIFQKNIPGYFPPDGPSRVEVEKTGGELCQVICDKPATLVYLANQACIELHVFLSKAGELERRISSSSISTRRARTASATRHCSHYGCVSCWKTS